MTANFQSGALRVRRGGHNPRQARLAIEYTNLMNLAARSDLIEVEALDVHPGWPPEKYLITYRCRGIVGIEPDGAPKFGEFHQVRMYLPSDYPLREPHMKWMTPIWHPNIDHELPNHVCTNTAQNYFAGKPLSDLVRAVGEMVQYVRYHAAWVPPYPLDRAAANWVIEYGEPRGIVSKAKPVDDRPLLKPQRVRLYGATAPPAAGAAPPGPQPAAAGSVTSTGSPTVRRRIRLGTSSLAVALEASGPSATSAAEVPLAAVAADDAPTVLLADIAPNLDWPSGTLEKRDLRMTEAIAKRLTGALERLGLMPGRSGLLCSACSESLPKHSHFCPRCGKPNAHDPVTCPYCFDTSVPPLARYCPRCGGPVHRTPLGTY